MRFLLVFIFFPFYCFSQDALLFEENIEKLNSKEKFEIIKIDLNNLGGADLGNYINYLRENKIRFNKYNSVFIKKAKSTKYPFDLYLLINELLKNKKRKNKITIQHLLVDKQKIWDVNNWSEQFWILIKENNFEIGNSSHYTWDSEGKKQYDIKSYLRSKTELNQLGNNPLLLINHKIVEYEPGKLLELLKNIEINNIEILDKSSSIKLFGKRGIDGQLKIFTTELE
ncbi:hypothetical protein [Moheibacter sediminis]|uniref:Uncharacterized protein n=1 Tax=Moheibacter sediminis TaxID=1434700 RepID=A0A1W2AYC9_9FLAO|nr:hypothetical protein [Moheibacter sediminis]SMC65719.1 hypothetical protein SAMN06296427_105140 [Moheibacter sediminis]